MAKLPRETLHKLAVLRTALHWRNGAYGPLRVHKTLFYADRNASVNATPRHIFTFKKYYKRQYSDDVNHALRELLKSSRLEICFDGPAARIVPKLNDDARAEIVHLFDAFFPHWSVSLEKAFSDVGYMKNHTLLEKAHSDSSYTQSEFNEIIFEGQLPAVVDIPELDDDLAERLSDLVDARLASVLTTQLIEAISRPFEETDWRKELFGIESRAAAS